MGHIYTENHLMLSEIKFGCAQGFSFFLLLILAILPQQAHQTVSKSIKCKRDERVSVGTPWHVQETEQAAVGTPWHCLGV